MGNYQRFMDSTMKLLLFALSIGNSVLFILFIYAFVLSVIGGFVDSFKPRIRRLLGLGIGIVVSGFVAVISLGFQTTIEGVF